MTLLKTIVLPAALASTLLAAVAGCGDTTIDAGKAEKAITKAVTEQARARVKSVSCPDDEVAKKGGTFTCKVIGTDGSTGNVLVTEKDDNGSVAISAPFIHPRDVEKGVAAGIEKQAAITGVTVTCPEIITGKAGAGTTCQAVSGKDKATVQVTQTDGKGGFRFKVLNSGGG
jgi:hypothetical protein